jgi:hypothetical protein
MTGDRLAGELVIRWSAIELHLVVRRQRSRFVQSFLSVAAARAFDVDDLDDRTGDARDRPVPSGFEHDGAVAREQPIHQLVHVLLQQRFAAGDLHELASVPADGGHDILD